MKLKYERETESIKEQKTLKDGSTSTNQYVYFTPADRDNMIRQFIAMTRPIRYPIPADVRELAPQPLQDI